MRVIAVDFDGTLCEDRYPEIGEVKQPVFDYLRNEKKKGSRIILWTCRVGESLQEAVDWCERYGLTFDAVNENLPEYIAIYRNDCRKIFAHIYIDDRAFLPDLLGMLLNN